MTTRTAHRRCAALLAGILVGLFAWLILGPAEPAAATTTAPSLAQGDMAQRGDRDPAVCSTLDSLCASGPAQRGAATVQSSKIDLIPDVDLNPLDDLGSVIAKAAADAWTAAMMAIWASGLFVLRIVLTYSEAFLTPDLGTDGPGREIYAFTLWMSGALATVLAMVQLGTAAFKREGKSLARAVIGTAQFVLAYACWFGYCAVVVTACGALSKALMKSMLSIQTWPDFDPLGGISTKDITDAGTATVLAFLGVFLWLAAIGHILVYLARAASLLVLAATGPIAAAGLVADSTRSWFWKSLRWFHAAAFTPVLMVLVLGIGVQFSNGVAASMADGAQKAIGTALPAVMLILVSVVTPMALFKLLAFVDPGTPSGASLRQGMSAVGGVQGLLSGGGAGGGAGAGGSSAASSADSNGRSSGEQSAEDATGDRFSKAAGGVMSMLGPVGAAAAAGMGVVTKAGGMATSLMSDQTNQAGVGQSTHAPNFSGMGGGRGGNQSGSAGGPDPTGDNSSDRDGGDGGGGSGGPSSPAMPPMSPTPGAPFGGAPAPAAAGPTPPTPAVGGGSSGAPAAGGAAGGATGGAAAGGAAIPIPPVA